MHLGHVGNYTDGKARPVGHHLHLHADAAARPANARPLSPLGEGGVQHQLPDVQLAGLGEFGQHQLQQFGPRRRPPSHPRAAASRSPRSGIGPACRSSGCRCGGCTPPWRSTPCHRPAAGRPWVGGSRRQQRPDPLPHAIQQLPLQAAARHGRHPCRPPSSLPDGTESTPG